MNKRGNTMVKISQKSRDELILMLRIERDAERCELMKELHAEAKVIKEPFDAKVDAWRGRVKEFETDILGELSKRSDALSEKQLLVFDSYDRYSSCPTSDLHPRLKEFDAESNKLKREIILM